MFGWRGLSVAVTNSGVISKTSANADGRDLALTLDLAKKEKSSWVASMGVPSESATGLVVTDVAVSGASVKFVVVELMMAKFDLAVTPAATLKGSFTNRGGTVPIEFRRTGEAHVELMAPSPAVSKDLEGDWEGTLAMGGGQGFQILVSLKNQPDGLVQATFQNLSLGQDAVPINDVRQAGQRVEFGLKVAHSSLQGMLNKEGTVLDGQFAHEGRPAAPLTLRRRKWAGRDPPGSRAVLVPVNVAVGQAFNVCEAKFVVRYSVTPDSGATRTSYSTNDTVDGRCVAIGAGTERFAALTASATRRSPPSWSTLRPSRAAPP